MIKFFTIYRPDIFSLHIIAGVYSYLPCIVFVYSILVSRRGECEYSVFLR